VGVKLELEALVDAECESGQGQEMAARLTIPRGLTKETYHRFCYSCI